ncbi:hypothetical protein ACA910_021310 [Epithemia clementina (nom. ined.)]
MPCDEMEEMQQQPKQQGGNDTRGSDKELMQHLARLLERQYDLTLDYCNALTALHNVVVTATNNSDTSTTATTTPLWTTTMGHYVTSRQEQQQEQRFQYQSDLIHQELELVMEKLSLVQRHRHDMEQVLQALSERTKQKDNNKYKILGEKSVIDTEDLWSSIFLERQRRPEHRQSHRVDTNGDDDNDWRVRLLVHNKIQEPLFQHINRTQRILRMIYQQGSMPLSSYGVPLASTPFSSSSNNHNNNNSNVTMDAQTLALSTLQASVHQLRVLLEHYLGPMEASPLQAP